MKTTPAIKAARQENLAKRRNLTALIDEKTWERKHLASIESEIMDEFKNTIIREIAATDCLYTIRCLLAQTPLNVGRIHREDSAVNSEIAKYNALCDEYTAIIEKLRNQKAKTASIMAVNDCLHPCNLV